jgi:GT2 family glycosyltransferase
LTLIETGDNGGFAAGNNVGIRHALHSDAKYIWLLNNDTLPTPDALPHMVAKAESDARLGAVGSVLYYAHDPKVVQCWGGGVIGRWFNTSRHATGPKADEWFDFLTAASILVPRRVFEEAGLLDDEFFLYWEDTDFSFRLRKNGWKLGVASQSHVLHKENASSGRNSCRVVRFSTASGIRFLRKHSAVPPLAILLFLFSRIGKRLVLGEFMRIRDVVAGIQDYRAQQRRLAKRTAARPFAVNATRVGETGGLKCFAQAMLQCLSSSYEGVLAILPERVTAPMRMKTYRTPGWLGSSSFVSRMRPLLWLAYSALLFPISRSTRVLSTTHHVLPFRRRQIATVHDLRPYYEPDSWLQGFYFQHMLPRLLRRCDGLLTVSESSKSEIVSVYRIDAEKVHVVPNSVDVRRFETRATSGDTVGPPYLLMVGASWKHKNAAELLSLHSLWAPHFRLKLLAGEGQYRTHLMSLTLMLELEDIVDFPVAVSYEELIDLYHGCAALVYPSRMEGFGLPPVEAMACGKPVLVSDIPVFRELFAEVPLYVRLGDAESWRQAFATLQKILRAGDESRIAAGVALANSFSQERMDTALSQNPRL